MKTVTTKKLSLDLQTLRTLTGDSMSNVVGGQNMGIVSTDTPTACIKDAPFCQGQPPRRRPRCPRPNE